MSTVVDQRVVEMKFDNQHFETNVKTTMSTLDKLKQSLNLKGASDGLDKVNAAAKNFDMSNMSNSVETVQAKFSALQVIGITALSNITTSAMNAATNIVKMFTIDPVTTGFQEYELKMNSVQTIMASTGASLETVNGYLEELNLYADKTIYSFSDMTQNIGKFTNAGVSLDKAVLAIKGVSNEAAVSGANANEASRAMYNFAQALSAGYVKLIDWKSIENANMATVEFKTQLLQTAVACGTLTDNLDGTYTTLEGDVVSATQNFNETLEQQWMTTDVLVDTLSKYADETTEIGKKAYASAQDVKTFSMMMDTLKEAAQSGWAQTWEIIVGDFEEAKTMWTYLSNMFGSVIEGMSNARNSFLESILGGKGTEAWSELSSKVKEAGVDVSEFQNALIEVGKEHGVVTDEMISDAGSFEKSLKRGWCSPKIVSEAIGRFVESGQTFEDTTEDMTAKLEKFQTVVDQVWNGDFLNGEERIEALTEAGYDYAEVQELVNKTVDGHRLTLEDLGEEQMRSIGFTEEQISAFKELQQQAEETGTDLNTLINEMSKENGRTLLLSGFKNILEQIQKIIDAIKTAWNDVFGDFDVSTPIYKAISSFAEWAEGIQVTDQTLQNITTTIRGFLDAVWLLGAFASGPIGFLNKMLTIAKNLLGFNFDILGVTAKIGKLLSSFKAWITKDNALMQSLSATGTKIWEFVNNAAIDINRFVKEFFALPSVQEKLEAIKNAFVNVGTAIKNWLGGFIQPVKTFVENLKALDGITLEGFMGAFASFCSDIFHQFTNLSGVFSNFGNIFHTIISVLSSFKDAALEKLGVTQETFNRFYKTTIGQMVYFAQEFVKNITNVPDAVKQAFSDTMKSLGEWGKGFGEILKQGLTSIKEFVQYVQNGGTEYVTVAKRMISDFGEAISKHFSNLKEIFNQFVSAIDTFRSKAGSNIDKIGAAFKGFYHILYEFFSFLKTAAKDYLGFSEIFTLAAGAGILYTIIKFGKLLDGLTKILFNFKEIGESIKGMFDSISGVAKSVSSAITGFGKAKALEAKSVALRNLAISVAILAASLVVLALVPWDKLKTGLIALGGVLAGVLLLAGALLLLSKIAIKGDPKGFIGLAASITAFIFAILGVAIALKIIETMNVEVVFANAVIVAGLMVGLCVAINKLSTHQKGLTRGNATLIALASSMLILSVALKILSTADLNSAAGGCLLLLVIIGSLCLVCEAFKKLKLPLKIGATILGFATAMLILVGVLKLLSLVSDEEVSRGIQVIGRFVLLFLVLTAITKYAGSVSGLGSMFIGISVAMLAMVAVIKLIAGISDEDLEKGINTIGRLSIFVIGLIAVSKLAGEHAAKAGVMLLALGVCLGILGFVLVLLSHLDPGGLGRATAAIAVLMAVMGGVIALTHFARISGNVVKALKQIMIAIGVMTIALAALSIIAHYDMGAMWTAIAGLTLVMGVFGGCLALIGQFGPKNTKAVVSIGLMAVVIGVIGGVLIALSALKTENALANAAGLSLVILALGASLYIIAKAGDISLKSIGALALMTLCVGMIGGVFIGLSALKAENTLEHAMALSLVIAVLSGVLLMLTGVQGSAVIGAAALLVVSVALVAVAGALALVANVDTGQLITVAIVLGALIAVLVVGSVIIQEFAVGAVVLAGVMIAFSVAILIGAAGFYIFAAALTLVGAALPAVSEGITLLGTGIKTFINEIASCSNNIGSFSNTMLTVGVTIVAVALLISGAMVIAAGGAVVLGAAAVVLGAGLLVAGAGLAATSGGIVLLGTAILFLCSSVAAGIQIVVGTFMNLSDQASSAGSNLVQGFANGISGSIGNVVSACIGFVSAIGQTICGLLGIHSPSVLAARWGENTGLGYAQGLEQSSTEGESSAKSFIDKIVGVFTGDTTASTAAKEAGSEAGKSLDSGFTENADMSEMLSKLGDGDFSTLLSSMNTTGGESADEFETGFGENFSLDDIMSQLGEGGLDTSSLTSKFDLAGSDSATSFGEGLSSGMSNISMDDTTNSMLESINAKQPEFTTAGSNLMVAFQNGITSGTEGVKSTLATLLQSLTDSLSNIQPTYTQLGMTLMTKISEGMMLGVGGAIGSATSSINSLMTSCVQTATTSASSFLSAGISVGQNLANGINQGGSSAFSAITSVVSQCVSYVLNSAGSLSSAGISLMSSFASGIIYGSGEVTSNISVIIEECLNIIAQSMSSFQDNGSKVVSYFADGISSNAGKAKDAVKSMVDSCKSAADGVYDSFYTSGGYAAEGFRDGINSKAQSAADAASDMVKAAIAAAQKAQGESSPAKAFIERARYSVLGYVKGIKDNESLASDATRTMVLDAIDGAKLAASKLGEALSDDFNVQPTISPVVDMASIDNANLRLNANIDAVITRPIDTMATLMTDAQNEINASNLSVIDAINSLRDDLNNLYSVDDQEIALYMDSRKVASTLVRPMNQQLNLALKRGGGL